MKYIFTPGPVKMSHEILAIGAEQTPYFRNAEFSKVMLENESMLLSIAHAPKGSRVVFLTASGTAAMEASVINLLTKEHKALVVTGGGFGERFATICSRFGVPHDTFTPEDNLSNLDFDGSSYSHFIVNAHETSVGRAYNLESIAAFCTKNGLLNITDAISLFLTDEVDMVQHAIDVLLISSQKAFALPPGISMVILSPRAQQELIDIPSLYFNFLAYLKDGERGQTPFTPAVSILLQLHARLTGIVKAGIESELTKAQKIAEYFRKAIAPLPLAFYHQEYMPNAMTTLMPTDGKKARQIVQDLEDRFDVVVCPNGGDLGNTIFRVSHMGDMTIEYTDVLIEALYSYYGVSK